ncbi:hypothetical protein BRC81_08640 [Halobacteriales archaeon QS_1_68_20]|nr:MAG: hypothetical protein BRC81_08640 [Halobacteriales archaeon QS_1_68_20]
MNVADRAREHLLTTRGDLVETVLSCADDVAAAVDEPADRETVTAALEHALEDETAFPRFVDAIHTTAETLKFDLPADPVAAPPYVVVTARGPMLRVTVDQGRLVVLLRAFERTPEGYVPAGRSPDAAVEVEFHKSG